MADQLGEAMIAEFKEAFTKFFGRNGDGQITAQQFVARIRAIRGVLNKPPDAEADALLEAIAADKAMVVDFKKFLELMVKPKAANPMELTTPQPPENPMELPPPENPMELTTPQPENPMELSPVMARAGKPKTFSSAFAPQSMDIDDDDS